MTPAAELVTFCCWGRASETYDHRLNTEVWLTARRRIISGRAVTSLSFTARSRRAINLTSTTLWQQWVEGVKQLWKSAELVVTVPADSCQRGTRFMSRVGLYCSVYSIIWTNYVIHIITGFLHRNFDWKIESYYKIQTLSLFPIIFTRPTL